MNGHNHNRHHANKSAIRIPQGNNVTNRSSNNNYVSYNTNKTSSIEQQQNQQPRTNSVQIINNSIQQQQVPQFSYNPLYMDPTHYSSDGHREDKHHNNLDELNGNHRDHGHHLTGDNLLDRDRDRDEEEDILNIIYHYQSESTENSCNKQQEQHHHQLQANFENRDGSDMTSSQYCDRNQLQQQQTVNINDSTNNNVIQTSSFVSRKQDIVGQFGAIQRPQSRPQSALGSSQYRSQQQQQSFQIQAYNDVNMAQQFPQIVSLCSAPSNNNKQRRKIEQDQIGSKKRLNNNHSTHNFNTQFQQQQFTLTSSNPANGSQIDLSEECNGLFVEYQTNRNSLGGLEELNSLNVSNCDGETLEEHINILSNEDCFATNDDLHDFGIGSTNDHFLNMLFLNNNNQTINSSGNVLQSSQQLNNQNTIDNLNQINITPSNSSSQLDSQHITGNISNQVVCEQQQQSSKQLEGRVQSPSRPAPMNQIAPAISSKIKTTKGKKNNNTSNKQVDCNNDPLGSKSSKSVDRKQSGSGKRKNSQKTETNYEINASQNKIATTNTNKRLMPKKHGGQQHQTMCNKQVGKKTTSSTASLNTSTSASPWMASPSSTSNTSIGSAMSPSSNSQFEYEAPYRLQLENLRRKLKMDIVPISTTTTIVGDQATNSQGNNKQNSISRVMNHQANLTSLNIFQTAQSNLEQQQSSNFSDQIDPRTTGTNGNTIYVSQQQQKRPNNLSCATTYVIARSIDSHNFETNGTVYLRTPNGLVPINSDRRSNLPIVNLAPETDIDYSNSSTTSSSNSNQPTTGTSTIITTNLTNQSGPTSVILRAGPLNDNINSSTNNNNNNTNRDSNNGEPSVTGNQVEAARLVLSSNHDSRIGSIVASMKGGKNGIIDDQSLLGGQIIRNTDCTDQALAAVGPVSDITQQVILSDPTTGQSNYCNNDRQQNDLVVESSQYQQHVNASSIQQQQQQQHTFTSREPAMQLDREASSSLTIKSLPSEPSINVSN